MPFGGGAEDAGRDAAVQRHLGDEGRLGGLGAVEDDAEHLAFVESDDRLLIALRIDEALGRLRLRRGEDLADLALFGDLAAVENGDARADLLDDAHLVRDDDDGDAETVVDVADEAEDGLGALRVERAGWPRRRGGSSASWRGRGRWPRAAAGRRRAGKDSFSACRRGRPAPEALLRASSRRRASCPPAPAGRQRCAGTCAA